MINVYVCYFMSLYDDEVIVKQFASEERSENEFENEYE